MDKQEIHEALSHTLSDLQEYYAGKSASEWATGPKDKWTSGQHTVHLIQSIKALNKGLSWPKFLLQYKFGSANRPSRDYDTVVGKYHTKLIAAAGRVSPFSKNMPDTPPDSKEKYLSELQSVTRKLQSKLDKLSDKQLDKYLMPHPLMGRMTLREIIMWTAYHTKHHQNVLEEKY